MKNLVFTFSILVMSMATLASEPLQNRSVTSTNGTTIRFEYRLTPGRTSGSRGDMNTLTADPGILFVSGAGGTFQPNDKVEAVVINKIYRESHCGGGSSQFQQVGSVTLNWNGHGMFTAHLTGLRRIDGENGPMKVLIQASDSCNTETGWLEIALSRNGQWAQDPINGTHNFVIRLK